MLKQSLSQKLLQKLSPQQIQFIKLLQMTTADFEERVEQELLDNPALEKSEEDFATFTAAEKRKKNSTMRKVLMTILIVQTTTVPKILMFLSF
jgi:DNA-directed RNA polymerase specialized sigma54-like protein